MTTPSREAIAREAAGRLHFTGDDPTGKEVFDFNVRIILSAIDRATEAALHDAADKARQIFAASDSNDYALIAKILQPFESESRAEPALGGQEWSIVQIEMPPIAAYDINDGQKCLDVNLEFNDAKTIKEAHNATIQK